MTDREPNLPAPSHYNQQAAIKSLEDEVIADMGAMALGASKQTDDEILHLAKDISKIPMTDLRAATPFTPDTFAVHTSVKGGFRGITDKSRPPKFEGQEMHILQPGGSLTTVKHPTLAFNRSKSKLISNRDGKVFINGHRIPKFLAKQMGYDYSLKRKDFSLID